VSRAAQYVVLNTAALIGCVVSLFIVPGNTTIRMWAVVAGLTIVLINYALHKRHKATSNERSERKQVTLVIWIGFALLLLDLAFSRYLR